ncbi:MAG: hypothetical protein RR409_01940 [Clostridium sp.]
MSKKYQALLIEVAKISDDKELKRLKSNKGKIINISNNKIKKLQSS